MRGHAIHLADPKPHGQTVVERRLNFRSVPQSSLRDGHLTKDADRKETHLNNKAVS